MLRFVLALCAMVWALNGLVRVASTGRLADGAVCVAVAVLWLILAELLHIEEQREKRDG